MMYARVYGMYRRQFYYCAQIQRGNGGPDYLKSRRSNHKAQVFARLCPGESASATIADDTNAADLL
jgi:hypothetical protein